MKELQELWDLLQLTFGKQTFPDFSLNDQLDDIASIFTAGVEKLKQNRTMESALHEFFAEVFPEYLSVLFPPVSISPDNEPTPTEQMVAQFKQLVQKIQLVQESSAPMPTVLLTSTVQNVVDELTPAILSTDEVTGSSNNVTASTSSQAAVSMTGSDWRQRIAEAKAKRMENMPAEQRAEIFGVKGKVGERNAQTLEALRATQNITASSSEVQIHGVSVSERRNALAGLSFGPKPSTISASRTDSSMPSANPAPDSSSAELTRVTPPLKLDESRIDDLQNLINSHLSSSVGFFAASSSSSAGQIEQSPSEGLRVRVLAVVKQAQECYENYHTVPANKTNPQFNLGYEEKLFSSWHHGKDGIDNSKNFSNGLKKEMDISVAIESYLLDSKTAYHVHSFSTYLIRFLSDFIKAEAKGLAILVPELPIRLVNGKYERTSAALISKGLRELCIDENPLLVAMSANGYE